jgi:hypothetical protein
MIRIKLREFFGINLSSYPNNKINRDKTIGKMTEKNFQVNSNSFLSG